MLPLWHRRVSRYIDSIILNGLIKCILNNTKLEKKKKGTTNCIYSVLGKCCYSFNFICDIIIIFPPFPARCSAREPSVNTADGSEGQSSHLVVAGRARSCARAGKDLSGGGWLSILGVHDCCRWGLLKLARSVLLGNVLFLPCVGASSGSVPRLVCSPCCLPFLVGMDQEL